MGVRRHHGLGDVPADRWESRRWVAFGVRAAITLVPVGAGIGISALASRLVPEPGALGSKVAWWAGMCVLSTAVLVAVDRQARRLLPLCLLLQLSLVFPDQAPSRFGAALRVGSARRLERRLEEARHGGHRDETVAEAAGRVLELATALRVHDRRTRGHVERVRAYADLLAEEMGLPAADREKLTWGALLHDVGKLEVPGAILNKPGKPDPEELAVLRRHPEAGARLMAPLADWLGPWALAASQHHERWDGGGYPARLKGEEISLSGRIVAVADAFEVMTALRSYKRPIGAAQARAELTRCAGRQFDPQVVRAMLNLSLGRMRRAMGPLTWLAQIPFLGGTPPIMVPATVGTMSRTLVLASAVQAASPAVALPPLAPAAAAASAHPQATGPADAGFVALGQAASAHLLTGGGASTSPSQPGDNEATKGSAARPVLPGPTSVSPPTTPAATPPANVGSSPTSSTASPASLPAPGVGAAEAGHQAATSTTSSTPTTVPTTAGTDPAFTPPGQANRPTTPPGLADKATIPPGQANRPTTPPGQAKKSARSGSAAGTATPTTLPNPVASTTTAAPVAATEPTSSTTAPPAHSTPSSPGAEHRNELGAS